MTAENFSVLEKSSSIDFVELPNSLKEEAISDLEANLSEGHKKPITKLEQLKEVLYQIPNENALSFALESVDQYNLLQHVMKNEDFGYPPSNTPVEKLKEIILTTSNTFMEARCWELLKQNDELEKFKNNKHFANKDTDYEDFIKKCRHNFKHGEEMIPEYLFSRQLSKTIINFVNPEDKQLIDLLAKYTDNGQNLHWETVAKIRDEEEMLKTLCLCEKNKYLKKYLEQPKDKRIKEQMPAFFVNFITTNSYHPERKIKAEELENILKIYSEQIAVMVLTQLSKDSEFERRLDT